MERRKFTREFKLGIKERRVSHARASPTLAG